MKTKAIKAMELKQKKITKQIDRLNKKRNAINNQITSLNALLDGYNTLRRSIKELNIDEEIISSLANEGIEVIGDLPLYYQQHTGEEIERVRNLVGRDKDLLRLVLVASLYMPLLKELGCY